MSTTTPKHEQNLIVVFYYFRVGIIIIRVGILFIFYDTRVGSRNYYYKGVHSDKMGINFTSESWVTDKNHPQGKYVGPSPTSSFPLVFRSSEKRERWYSTPESWLRGKIRDDNIDKNLWRVHNKLYDLTNFIRRHPGGSEWLSMTRGMDITELFESNHVVEVDKVEATLKTFYVKEATEPRNSPYTFHQNGFYKTLKKRVASVLKEKGTGPTFVACLLQDLMVVGFALFSILGIVLNSYWPIVLAGLSLGISSASAHNFFHIRDNWRKYYFDLSLCSHYEWRIEHVFSHHGFTNTSWDEEVLMVKPWVEFLVNRKKHWIQRFGSRLYAHLIMPLFFPFQLFCRVTSIVVGEQKIRPENFLPFLQLVVFATFAKTGAMTGLAFWITLHMTCSYWIISLGAYGGHHHPVCFHDGDQPRAKPDYGLCMLDTTCVKLDDKIWNLLQLMATFGDHYLHHLFPSVCISKIGHVKPIVEETVKDFEEQFIFLTQWQLITGMYEQMARIEPHSFQYYLEQRRKTQI